MKKKYAVFDGCAAVLILLCITIGFFAQQKQKFFNDTTPIADTADISDVLSENAKNLKETTGIQFDLRISMHRELAKNYSKIQIMDESIATHPSALDDKTVKIHTWKFAEDDFFINLICVENAAKRSDGISFICQITDKTGKGLSKKQLL